MIERLFRSFWAAMIAVVFSVAGGVLMFLVGATSTVRGIGVYFGTEDAHSAFSEEAGLAATLDLISALDQFLLGLVLFIFGYGVYRLFLLPDPEDPKYPPKFNIRSVSDLKIKVLETIAILLAVLFLKSVLKSETGVLEWSALVVPISVGIFAASIWVIHRAH